MVARGEVSFIVLSKCVFLSYLFPSVIIVVLATVLIAPIWLKAVYSEKT
jgi:hypothetical protein